MRRSPRSMTLVSAGALLVLALAAGCSSSRKTTAEVPEPTQPPPTTQTQAPPEDTAPPPPSPTETATRLEDAFFDYDDASLRDDAKNALESNARYLQSNPGVRVVIEGHCDERGSVEYNLALGEKRARAAKQFLTSYGIESGRMTTISYGKERPFDSGHDESAWAKNRRAHFKVQ